MAWYSPYGDQNLAWHGGYHDPRSQFHVAARQSPCDPEYGYSRPLYTNYGGYSTPANPVVAQPLQGREPEWLRESRRQDEAWEQRHDGRPVSQVCIHDRGNAKGTPRALPARTTATRITAATAKGASNHAGIDAGEEAARQITTATTPPPARPARSAARTPPPPIPPRSTRPRIDTRNDDARVEVRARDTTWQEPPPARPPPRPARAAARRPKNPAHIEHPPDAPLLVYATSARATSPGDADRTAPTNDRPSSSSTSTATAPPTHPVPSAAAPTHSQSAPLSPRRLCGPRAPRNASDHRLTRTIDSNDVLQDVNYLRAIAGYAGEGGDGREIHREDEEDALMRSVRGTLFPALQSTNSQLRHDRAPARAIGTLPRTTTTSAAYTGHGGCGLRGQVESAIPTPLLVHHGCDANGETRESKSSWGMANSSPHETAARRNNHARPTPTPTRRDSTPNMPSRAPLDDIGQMLLTSSNTHDLSSMPTPNAPSAHPVPTTALSLPLPVLSLPSPHLIGPRNPPHRLENRVTRMREHIHSPQDVARPRAIECHGREGGGQEGERAGDAEDARELSVRGTQTSASHTADRDFPRGLAPPRAPGTLAHAISRATGTATHNKLGLAQSAVHRARLDEQGHAISAPSGLVSSESRTMTIMSRDGCTTATTSSRPLRFLSSPPPPPSRSCPALTRPTFSDVRAPRPHATQLSARKPDTASTTAHAHQEAAQRASPRAEAGRDEEYTRADSIRLARAPPVSCPIHSPAGDHEQEGGEGLHRAHAGYGSARTDQTPSMHAKTPRADNNNAPATPPYRHVVPRSKSLRLQSSLHPQSSRPAPLKHPTPPMLPTSFELSARTTPLAGSRTHKEYTGADSVRLARAPEVTPVVPSTVPLTNGSTSYVDRQHRHPPPLPHLQRPGIPPPTPPDWPFPISVTEMGWVLAAVVMARNMDREEERRQREYEDDDHFSIWGSNSEDGRDDDPAMHDGNSAATFCPSLDMSLSERGDTETVTYDGEHANTMAGSDWYENSVVSFDEPSGFSHDREEYEQASDGQVSDEP